VLALLAAVPVHLLLALLVARLLEPRHLSLPTVDGRVPGGLDEGMSREALIHYQLRVLAWEARRVCNVDGATCRWPGSEASERQTESPIDAYAEAGRLRKRRSRRDRARVGLVDRGPRDRLCRTGTLYRRPRLARSHP
jgi:hypothetical protein